MQTVILAGGLGTRLRSVVNDRPKSMADIDGRPFLEYQLEFLKKHRIVDVVLCAGYRHRQIQAHFDDGRAWGVRIRYSIETRPLGTAGALKLAQRHLKETFMVLNGDSYFELDLLELMQFHENRKAVHHGTVGTIALTEAGDARQYGTIETGRENRIVSFVEKSAAIGAGRINAGIYVLEPAILSHLSPREKASLEHEVFPAILKGGGALFGYQADGFFVDIGTPDGYRTMTGHIGKHANDHSQQSALAH